jgi:MYXO-CTERM domain-containing protein
MKESMSRRTPTGGISATAATLVLALAGSLAAVGCADPPSAAELEPPAPGALRGELVLYTASYDDGTSDEQYFLRVGGNERDERRLFFTNPSDLAPGGLVDVWATPRGEGLEVTRIEPVKTGSGAIEEIAQKLIGAPAQRARSFAFVLVDVGGGVNLTVEEANRRLFSSVPPMGNQTASVRQYFNEASYGRQDVTGKVFGPFQFTMTGCGTRAMATALKPMIEGKFDHYLWYMGSRVAACGWSGLASSGTAGRPSVDTWYNASGGCGVLIQEPGHNFGMRHSSGMNCMDGAVPFLDAPSRVCAHSEYGDRFDPMGSGGCKHMNSFQKSYVGWLGKCNMVEVTTSGTYTLLPIELPCNGIQSLQIAMPKPRPFFRSGGGGGSGDTVLTHYYIEMRAPIGIDRQLRPEVQVRVSGDTKLATQRPTHTWFLDMKGPMPTGQQGLVAGESYTDPDPASPIKFTVETLEARQATVRIEIPGTTPGGPAICVLDNTPMMATTLMGPGPGPESCEAAPFSINGTPPAAVPTGDGGVAPATPAPTPAARPDGGPPVTGEGPTGGGAPPAAPSPPGAGAPTPVEPVGSSEPVPAGCSCRLDGGNSGGNSGGALLLLGFAALLVGRSRRGRD